LGRLTDLVGRRLHVDANVPIYAVESLEPWDQIAKAVLELGETAQSEVGTSALALAECLVKPIQSGDADLQNVYLAAIQNRSGLFVADVLRKFLIEAASVRAANPACKMPDAVHHATAKLLACDVFVTNDSV
jgi:predicted nucleic acid-binding protein